MGELALCPYCGRLVDEDDIERPADYCHHQDVRRGMHSPWDYLYAGWRVGMIEAAKEATKAAGIPVYDHDPLCSNFAQPAEGCWQCRIIRDMATNGPTPD